MSVSPQQNEYDKHMEMSAYISKLSQIRCDRLLFKIAEAARYAVRGQPETEAEAFTQQAFIAFAANLEAIAEEAP